MQRKISLVTLALDLLCDEKLGLRICKYKISNGMTVLLDIPHSAAPWRWTEPKGEYSNWWQWSCRRVRHQPLSSSRMAMQMNTMSHLGRQLVYWQCMKNPHIEFWREAPCYKLHPPVVSASHRYPQRDLSLKVKA